MIGALPLTNCSMMSTVIMASTTVDEARVQRGQAELEDTEAGNQLLSLVKPIAPPPAAPIDPKQDPIK